MLTLVNSIGFAISALSIEFFVRWSEHAPLAQVLPWVGLGAVVGLLMLWPLLRRDRAVKGASRTPLTVLLLFKVLFDRLEVVSIDDPSQLQVQRELGALG